MAAFLLVLAWLAGPGGAAPQGLPITGRVVDEAGEGLAGARVELVPILPSYEAGRRWLAERSEPEPAAAVSTGERGSFRLVAPAPGMWRLVARAPGRLAMEARLEPLLEPVELAPVTLPTSSEIEVRVVSAGRRPVADAWVRATPSPLSPGRKAGGEGWWVAPRLARADGAGAVRVPRAAWEALSLAALGPNGAEAFVELVQGDAPTLALPAVEPLSIEVRDPGGRLAAGVLVSLSEAWWPLGLTGEDGQLALGVPSTGEVAIALETAALAGGRSRLQRAGGAARRPLRFRLEPAQQLSGTVTDAASGRPVAGALVWPQGDAARHTRTGPDGTYRLEVAPNLPPLARLHAAAVGYLPARLQLTRSEPSRAAERSFELTPRAYLAGRVVDEEGGAVGGAHLALSAAGGRFDRPSLGAGRQARGESGADGRFQLPAFPGAFCRLEVEALGFVPAEIETSDLGRPVEVVLSRGRVGRGRVVGPGGEPVAGAFVALARVAEEGWRRWPRVSRALEVLEGESGEEGRFSLAPLAAGRFHLDVEAPGFAPARLPAVAIAEGRDAFDFGTVRLAPGVGLEGRVVDAAGRPLAEARVTILERAWMRAENTGRAWRPGRETTVTTGEDGRFHFADLGRGERVSLRVARAGYAEVGLEGVVVPTTEPLRVVLAAGATLRGQVVDGRGSGVSGASVSVRTEHPSGGEMIFGHDADEAGRFALEGVGPGRVRLAASAPGFRPREQELTVEPGAEVGDLFLVLQEGVVLEGEVTGPRGDPLVAHVRVARDPAGAWKPDGGLTVTDEAGRYRLAGLAPGPSTVEVRVEGGPRQVVREIALLAGVNYLDVVVPDGQEVRGRVIDEAGRPVGGVQVTLAATASGHRGWGTSGGEGEFLMSEVLDGQYRLRAMKEGYPVAESEDFVNVEGAPVAGLEIVLGAGGTIRGAVLGLGPASFPAVSVAAWSEVAPQSAWAAVDGEGRYELAALGPGPWRVAATDRRTGRTVEGRTALEAGPGEAVLDLDFGAGLVVSGRVRIDAQPAAGASVGVEGLEVTARSSASTDAGGRFELPGLPAGHYRLSVDAFGNRIRHRRTIAVEEATELAIDLATAGLAGRVVEEGTGRPIDGAVLVLLGSGTEGYPDGGIGPRVETDADGRFDLGRVAEGEARLKVEKRGFAPGDAALQLIGGNRLEVEVRMVPAGGGEGAVEEP